MIPTATTTIAVLRSPESDQYDEPYGGSDLGSRTAVATGVRAVIDRPTGREQVAGGEQSQVSLALICDPCDITYRDLVRDEKTGTVYKVMWVLNYGTSAHVEGGIQIVEGVV